jgi:ElaB/YqjD/DUF883 family membrane-anchored ribosome-binding protein
MTDIANDFGSVKSQTDAEMLKQKAAAAKDAVVDLGSEAKRYASHRMSDAREKAGEWAQTAKEKVGHVNENVVDYVQRNPFKAIGMAVGIGFVAGLMLKRR